MAPVGFRFHPTDEEIIGHYLTLKLNGCDSLVDDHIGEIDHLYRQDPWDLTAYAKTKSDDGVWYFFCRRDYKYANSKRANRTTKNGNWKLTSKSRDIKLRRTDEVIGTKKYLVFQYKCPDTKKAVNTSWIIHEFQAKNSPPDERLVLCRLKYNANDSVATSPNDEGEPRRVTGSDVENNAAQTNIQEVDEEQRLFLIDSHEEDFNFPLPLQSQNDVQNFLSDEGDLIGFADSFLIVPDEHDTENSAQSVALHLPLQSQNDVLNFHSDEEDLIGFADSFLIVPDEHDTENSVQYSLQNDYSPPRSSTKAYVEGSSDRATYPGYGVTESSNLYGGHGSSKEYRQMQMAHSDDILLMGASAMGSTTATRHEQINLMQSVGEELPRIHKPLPPPKSPSFIGRENVSRQLELQCEISSPVSKHKTRSSRFNDLPLQEGRRRGANMDLPQKESFGIESEKGRKIVEVTNAKPDVKSRSKESAGNDRKGRFIHFETAISSHRSSPGLVYFLNAVLGVVMFFIILREVLIVH